jgi:hypothetical protein
MLVAVPFEISHGILSEKITEFDPDLQILLCESRHLRADRSVGFRSWQISLESVFMG